MTIEHSEQLAIKAILKDLIKSGDPKMSSPAVITNLVMLCVAMLASLDCDKMEDAELKTFLLRFSKAIFHGLRAVDERENEASKIVGRFQ